MEDFAPVIERITDLIAKAQVNLVFGEPKKVQGRVLIPVGEVSYGLGLGRNSCAHTCTCEDQDETACCEGTACACTDSVFCEDEESSSSEEGASGFAGGVGAHVRPLAYIDVGPDGAKVVPIHDEQKIALAGIGLLIWCFGWIGLVLTSLRRR